MQERPTSNDRDHQQRHLDEQAETERWELLENLQAILEPFMIGLGLFFLVLLFVDYAGLAAGTGYEGWLATTFDVIWIIFIIDFVLRYVIAPQPFPKLSFLKTNWLTILSLALPALRPLRAFRALRALRAARATRSLSLIRLVGGVNRGLRVLRRIVGGQQIAYIAATTVLVALAGAAGIWYFDRGNPESPIQDFGDALWWSSSLVTTINNEIYPVSAEARVIGILMRIYALSVFGFITATIATYFLGKQAEEQAEEQAEGTAHVEDQLRALRHEISMLREELARTAPELSGTLNSGGGTDEFVAENVNNQR